MSLRIAWVSGSDTQLEIATEVARAFARSEGAECTLVSTRAFLGLSEYPDAATREFAFVLAPSRLDAGRFSKIAGRILRRARLPKWAERFERPSITACFPFLRDDRRRFDLVFLLNDRGFPELDLARAFQARGTPVFLLQESIRRDDSFDDRPGLLWNGQGGCDRVYAWGDTSLAYYRKAGVPGDRLIAVGCPRIDLYVEQGREPGAAKALRACLGIPEGKRVLLLATNPVHRMKLREPLRERDYIAAIKACVEWASECSAHVLVKPHLLERKDFAEWGLDAWLESRPDASYLPDVLLADTVRASDAVAIFNSTVALEAALLGKPSALVAAGRYSHGTDFLETGLSETVDGPEDLRSLLTSQGEADFSALTRPYVLSSQGTATRIVGDAVNWLKTRAAQRGPAAKGEK